MIRGLASCLLLITCCQAAPAQDLKVFFGNLHSHTSYSDGVQTPKEAYKHARDIAKLDFLAITEHNHRQAGRIAGNHALYNGPSSNSLIQQSKRFTIARQSGWPSRVNQDDKGSRGIWIMRLLIDAGKR